HPPSSAPYPPSLHDALPIYVAGPHLGTDVHHARLVEAVQRLLGDVGDVGGDLLRTELGVAGDRGQLFDVDGGVAVFLDHALGQEDRKSTRLNSSHVKISYAV